MVKDDTQAQNDLALVNPTQACAMLGGISPPTLYKMIERGEIESFKDGRARRVTVRSINARIQRKLAEAGAGK